VVITEQLIRMEVICGDLILGTTSAFGWSDWRKLREAPGRIAGLEPRFESGPPEYEDECYSFERDVLALQDLLYCTSIWAIMLASSAYGN
jgi:hypothetical protein